MKDDIMTDSLLGSRLKFVRKQRKMTLKMLSSQTGISSRGISLIEKGEKPIKSSQFAVITFALEISPAALYEPGGLLWTMAMGRKLPPDMQELDVEQ